MACQAQWFDIPNNQTSIDHYKFDDEDSHVLYLKATRTNLRKRTSKHLPAPHAEKLLKSIEQLMSGVWPVLDKRVKRRSKVVAIFSGGDEYIFTKRTFKMCVQVIEEMLRYQIRFSQDMKTVQVISMDIPLTQLRKYTSLF